MRDIALDDLALFVTVVRAGGVRAAASRLELPRSTVSRRLLALERALGVDLLRRTTGRVALTDVGRTHFDRAARVVDEAEELCADLQGSAREPRGTLRLAASQFFAEEVLPPLIAAYTAAHPYVRVECLLDTARIDLVAASIDLAFRTGPLGDSASQIAVRLGPATQALFAARSYADRRGLPETPADLAHHDVIAIAEPGATVLWPLREGDRVVQHRLRPRIQSGSYLLARRLCAAGAGITRMPDFAVAAGLQSGALVPVLREHWVTNQVFAVYPKGTTAAPKTRAMLALVKQAFVGGPPWTRAAGRRDEP